MIFVLTIINNVNIVGHYSLLVTPLYSLLGTQTPRAFDIVKNYKQEYGKYYTKDYFKDYISHFF